MNRWTKLTSRVVALLTLLVLATAAVAQDYDLIELEPPGFEIARSTPLAINEWGQVVGWFEEVSDTYLNGPMHGFLYDPMLDTYWVTPVDFALVDINNLGQMVGEDWSELALVAWEVRNYRRHGTVAFFYDGLGGEPQPLLPLPGDEIASVTGINDAGLIIGFSYDESILSEPFLPLYIVTPVVWQVTSEGVSPPMALPLLDNHFVGRPEGIGPANANGVCAIVGASGNYSNSQAETAVRWKVKLKSNGTLILQEGPLALGSSSNPQKRNVGWAVNGGFFSVGTLDTDDAFKKTNNGAVKYLKGLKSGSVQWAATKVWDVNDAKEDVVGALFGPGTSHAAVWVGGTQPIDLNDHVTLPNRTHLNKALSINNSGAIAVEMITTSKKVRPRTHAGLLIPIR